MLSIPIISKCLTVAASVGAAAVLVAGGPHLSVSPRESSAYVVADLGPVSDESWSEDAGAGSLAFRAGLIADAPFLYAPDNGCTPEPAASGFVCRQGDSGLAIGYYRRLPGDGRDHAFEREHGWARDLGSLCPGGASRACAINRRGDVVGWAVAAGSTPHAFLVHDGSAMLDLNVSLPGLCSIAQDINESGVMVGTREIGDGSRCHAFLLAPGGQAAPVDLGTLGGGSSHAYRINSAGWVVGSAETASGEEHAFLYDGSSMRDLNDMAPRTAGWELQRAYCVNDHRQIAGIGLFYGERHAFALTPAKKTP